MLQVALQRPALAAHPEQHPRQDGDSQDRGDALCCFLDDERQPADRRDDGDARGDRQGDRGDHPDPDLRQGVAPANLHEVGGDDPDNQSGLEALAQGDEERGNHVA